ncbi:MULTISPECIES: haloacid dehalogenase type II [unclassified Cryobacterium]|uniref:haloacid dehalogenase type II n=1 Tax=unclassified Cryobacterium TaxID=2649013 RepID=UPI002AB5CE46|nr:MULTISPECIES: haloacid dehalogenase type II [unclassified Cryobacterium]MDY7541339.1 haloacid dehalogenase type II [Cryobacterium sp. 5B3]MEA9998139.1 haloacid dehalogenase type II [Cryobacterium sp. RTS3]MEB0265329.1 haloacid dehalogenase type II [Cryobacterium sp. 10I5]MEB0273362.1 haloacid dehalogenase type II [Cryobacterium sp. 5B3]
MTYSTPSVIVFDVNETLSDMSPLKARFVEVGAPAHLARIWFATLLRDGFALAAAGGSAKFAVIGSEILRGFLRDSALSRSLDDAVNHIMDGFGTLSVHPDIAEGIRALKSMDMRLVTLSNGSAQVAEDLLAGAGLRSDFEDLLTVEDAPAWKPVRAAYDYAADVCGVQPADMLLVAVHPWDIHGAAQAGLRTAWLNRTTEIYPDYFAAPDYTITSLGELATRLADDPVQTTREN